MKFELHLKRSVERITDFWSNRPEEITIVKNQFAILLMSSHEMITYYLHGRDLKSIFLSYWNIFYCNGHYVILERENPPPR